MTSFQVLLAPAIDRLRRGDVQGARAVAEEALAKAPADTALLEFLGLMATRTGDPSSTIPYFRRWLEVAPEDRTARLNLAAALTAAGELEEAAKLVSDPRGDLRFLRLAGYVFQQLGRLDEAAAAYEAVVATHPDDFETWNNLGNVRAAQGNPDAAIIALGRAVALRPDVVPMAMNLSEILARADRPQARQALMRDAAARAPDNAEVMTELGLAEAGARDHAAAERAFREAIRLNPQALAAYVELGVLLENLNRLDDLDALVSAAEANGVTAVEVDFLKAWNLRRQGRFEEALPLAEATPASINPIRRTQLIAEVNDRVGNTARAFAAYAEMNAASLAASQALAGPSYRDLVEAGTARLTPEHVARWTKVAVDLCPPAPA